MSYNQSQDRFATGLTNGFKIYQCCPYNVVCEKSKKVIRT